MEKNKKWWNIIKLLLKLSVTIGSLWWVSRKIDFAGVIQVFKTSNLWFILPAIAFFVLSQVISSLRLNVFFGAIGLKLTLPTNLKLYWLGMFYNLFLPGGIGGDGYKIWLLRRNSEASGKQLFWSILLDRLSGLAALGLLLSSLIAVVDFPEQLNNLIALPKIPYIITTLAALGFLLLYSLYYLFFRQFISCFWRSTFLGLLVQLAQLLCLVCILKSLGINSDFREYLLLFLLSSVVAILPITIGGLGARELVFLFGSQYLHLDSHYAVSISLWFYLITLMVSFAGVYYVFNEFKLEEKRG